MQNTEQTVSGVNVLVDWVSLTDKSGLLSPCELVPNLDPAGWVALEHGAMGYRKALRHGHVTIYFDGSAGMGQHLVLSGQGCREVEGAGLSDWAGLFGYWLDLGVSFTRLDVAIDDRAGLLNLREMNEKLEREEATTRFRDRRVYQDSPAVGSRSTGYTIQLGKRSSDCCMRLYDKAAERLRASASGQGSDLTFEEREALRVAHWVRVEVEFHGERAGAAALALRQADGVAVMSGVIRGYLDFKEGSASDVNHSRWETSAFWVAFLGGAAKCRLSVEGVARSLAKVVAWLDRQVWPSMALYVESIGGDVDELLRKVSRGRDRWRPEHLAMLAAVA